MPKQKKVRTIAVRHVLSEVDAVLTSLVRGKRTYGTAYVEHVRRTRFNLRKVMRIEDDFQHIIINDHALVEVRKRARRAATFKVGDKVRLIGKKRTAKIVRTLAPAVPGGVIVKPKLDGLNYWNVSDLEKVTL